MEKKRQEKMNESIPLTKIKRGKKCKPERFDVEAAKKLKNQERNRCVVRPEKGGGRRRSE